MKLKQVILSTILNIDFNKNEIFNSLKLLACRICESNGFANIPVI